MKRNESSESLSNHKNLKFENLHLYYGINDLSPGQNLLRNLDKKRLLENRPIYVFAMNPDEVSQVQFASQIKDVMAPFPPSWISTQFVSFLTSWLPLNNKTVMKHVCSAISDIVQKAESISSLSPFFEAVLSSENPNASPAIEEAIKGNQKTTQIDDLLQNLIQSQYDAVRAFVPRVIQFASSDQTKLKMFKKLLTDSSFAVRFEVTKYVPLLPEKAAIYFANALTKDVHPRIRSTLPIRFAKFNFFISTIATNLKSDSDWSVRACLCSQLPLCQESENAGSIALELINDSVWQVSYSALKAYSAILSANETATVENAPAVLESLSKSIQTASQSCLKFAVLDTFFGVASRSSIPEDSLVQFSNSILDSQPSPIKLHYIEGITKSGKPELVNLIKDNATTIIEEGVQPVLYRVMDLLATTPEFPILDGQYEILTICEDKICKNNVLISSNGLIKTSVDLKRTYGQYNEPLTFTID